MRFSQNLGEQCMLDQFLPYVNKQSGGGHVFRSSWDVSGRSLSLNMRHYLWYMHAVQKLQWCRRPNFILF
jgi:hypothetical protein